MAIARTRWVVQNLWPYFALAVPLTGVVFLARLGSNTLDQRVILMLLNMIVVIGMYIFIGNSGVLSFGHISFMAIGAYACAIVSIPPIMKSFLMPGLPGVLQRAELGSVPAALVGGLFAACFALLIAGPLMRLSGLAAGLATFAVLITVNVILAQWDSVTRGAQGIQGVPIDTTARVALVWTLIAMAVAFAFQRTRFALRLQASREDEVAARSVGINITRERATALVVSAFVVGIAGALYARFLGVLLPETFFFELTAITIAMLVIGGTNSLAGAVIGTAVVSGVSEELRRMEAGQNFGPIHVALRPGLEEVGVALLMLLILVYRPKGITGGREIPWPRRWKTEIRATPDPGATEYGERRRNDPRPRAADRSAAGDAHASRRHPAMSRLAETLGFDELWFAEDYFYTGAFSTAAAALASTETIGVATGIVSALVRHPAVLAMEIASVARMFPGRFRPGIALGHPPAIRSIDLYPRSPLGAVRDCMTVVRALLSGQEVSHSGETFSLHDVHLAHVAPDGLQLLQGGMGPKMIQLAGEIADGVVIPLMAAPAYVTWIREQLAIGLARRGDEGHRHSVTVFVFFSLADDPAEARSAVKRTVAFYLYELSKVADPTERVWNSRTCEEQGG